MFEIDWEKLDTLNDHDFMAALKEWFRVCVLEDKEDFLLLTKTTRTKKLVIHHRQRECLYFLEEILQYVRMERDLPDLDKELEHWTDRVQQKIILEDAIELLDRTRKELYKERPTKLIPLLIQLQEVADV